MRQLPQVPGHEALQILQPPELLPDVPEPADLLAQGGLLPVRLGEVGPEFLGADRADSVLLEAPLALEVEPVQALVERLEPALRRPQRLPLPGELPLDMPPQEPRVADQAPHESPHPPLQPRRRVVAAGRARPPAAEEVTDESS